ncbi:MAG: hypothetical protein QN178_01950 [Armatimonadota bacterium]|nr:hypothetical protein [Armatimonadota bacterium]
MEIAVAEQGVFILPAKLTPEQAKEKAWEQKLNVFGTLSKVFKRPKSEEIQVRPLELRFQPFWYAASHKRFRYNRRAQYQVSVTGDVQSVEIAGQTYTPSGQRFVLPAVDHCLFEEQREIFVDALTGESLDLRRYLPFDRVAVVDGQSFPADVAAVSPEVRASAVVRQVLGDVLHPPTADHVLEEVVVVDRLDLYYRPVYAFECAWAAQGKRNTIEVDGLTGEFKPMGKAFGPQLRKVLNREVLFDVGAETLGLVVPGGGIVVKLTKAVIDGRASKG